MGKRNKDNLLWLDSWDDALEALETTHTISLSQVCMLLQASRPWVNKYIRPHISAVYISTWPGKDGWPVTWKASRALGKEIKDSIWFNETQLYDYLDSCVVSCTAKTKLMPYAELVPKRRRNSFRREMEDVIQEIKKAYDSREPADDGWDHCEYLRNKYITGERERALIERSTMPSCLGDDRTRVPAVPVPQIPVREASKEWHTIADARGYGGVDELVYRDLYIHGAHRMELHFDSPQGTGKKIYYYPDPEPYQEVEESYRDRVARGCLVALVRRGMYDAWREQT